MENIRDRVNFHFISHDQIQKRTYRLPKLSFKCIVDLNESFSVFKYDKERILFDKPILLGFCILELSKLSMYEF